MSPTIENLQQLIARVSPVRTNNSTASTPNRFHELNKDISGRLFHVDKVSL